MGEQQLAVRDFILEHQAIPPEIDLLFINAAYETSINIRNEDFQTMIVHSGNTDVQTQVRGRLRHDIEHLYIYDAKHVNISQYFPEEYYGKPLFRKDTERIATHMNLKNEKGRGQKWPSIAKLLQKDGLIVNKIKVKGRRAWIVYPNDALAC